jgi:hypothetical protein
MQLCVFVKVDQRLAVDVPDIGISVRCECQVSQIKTEEGDARWRDGTDFSSVHRVVFGVVGCFFDVLEGGRGFSGHNLQQNDDKKKNQQ